MRYKLTLRRLSSPCSIPIDYQYLLRAAIYKMLAQVNPQYATFLHQTGYQHQGKAFKFFTFSTLDIPYGGWKLDKKDEKNKRLQIWADELSLEISFLIDKASALFITSSMLHQTLVIADKQAHNEFIIERIEEMPDTIGQALAQASTQSLVFRTCTPVVVAKQNPRHERKGKTYLAPAHGMFDYIFIKNLVDKYHAYLQFSQRALPGGFTVKPALDVIKVHRRKKITIGAGADIIGYLFDFRLTAPKEMMEIGFYGGFGSKSTYGFGYTDVLTC